MSPRRNRPRRNAQPELNQAAARIGYELHEEWLGEQWTVRFIPGIAAVKTYRCPGCDHEIMAGTAHVVVWPAEHGGPEERRHWHSACWRARDRRKPPRSGL
jgi:hypothetical protein